MQNAKLGLSEEERRLAMDPGIILTKNRVIEKVYGLFGSMADVLREMPWHGNEDAVSPKISKGENYRGLPYVMLDYPRLFSNQHVMALRTHFWWGNYISVTLHLKGLYKDRFWEQVAGAIGRLQEAYWVACTDDEWEHAVVAPFYREIRTMEADAFRTHIGSHPFLKISRKFPLEKDEVGIELVKTYQDLNEMLNPHPQP